jgi:sialidase-1
MAACVVALMAIGSGREAAIEILRAGLEGSEFWPAMHAAEALSRAGQGDLVVAALSDRLDRETDPQRRCGLARELVRAGRDEHVAVLFAVLGSDDPWGHVHAAESLFKLGAVGDGKLLRGALAAADRRLNVMAAAALARSGDAAAARQLRALAREPDDKLAGLAAWTIGLLAEHGRSEPGDVALLTDRLKTVADPTDRSFFEHALAILGDADGRARLLANLRSPQVALRCAAAAAAGDAGLAEAVEPLREILETDPAAGPAAEASAAADARIRAADSWLRLTR